MDNQQVTRDRLLSALREQLEAEDWFHELAREVGDGPGPDAIVNGGRQTARREEA